MRQIVLKLQTSDKGAQETSQHTLYETAANPWCRHSRSQRGQLCSRQRNQHHSGSTFLITNCVSKSPGKQCFPITNRRYLSILIFIHWKCHWNVKANKPFLRWQNSETITCRPSAQGHWRTPLRQRKGWQTEMWMYTICESIQNLILIVGIRYQNYMYTCNKILLVNVPRR